jgi:hypothetical protein
MINFNNFNKLITETNLINDDYLKVDEIIDNAYIYFKKINKKINTLDIIEYVEDKIGKELDDDDYNELYYRITGEDYNGDEIMDLEDEDKFYVK